MSNIFTESLEVCRFHILSRLQRQLETQMTPYIAEAANPCEHDCQAMTRAGHYMKQLHRLGLWPLTGILAEESINTILGRLNDYQCFVSPKYPCICLRSSKIEDEIDVEYISSCFELKGLCLNCVKKGRLGALRDNCMVAPRSGECGNQAMTT